MVIAIDDIMVLTLHAPRVNATVSVAAHSWRFTYLCGISPLCERPIFHHLERRVETHNFLCVLAYHLLICIERAFLEQGIHTSWETLRTQLSTHQVVIVRLPTTDGRALTVRRDTRPEQIRRDIYRVLRVPEPSSPQSSDGPKIVTECARQPVTNQDRFCKARKLG